MRRASTLRYFGSFPVAAGRAGSALQADHDPT